MIFGRVGMMQRKINNFVMENDKLVYPLSIEDSQDYSGGSWLSYALGYILSSLDIVEGKDETKYGGQYLESFGSHSSII